MKNSLKNVNKRNRWKFCRICFSPFHFVGKAYRVLSAGLKRNLFQALILLQFSTATLCI